jgi:hypothetical protein
VDCDPLIGSLPDHPPEALQAVALVVDQVKLELPPLTTVLGLADSATVGAGAGEVTDTVVAWLALPPGPVQVSENVALAFSAPLDCEPLTALAPAQLPAAVQAEALLDDHDKVALLPLLIVLGLATSATVGGGGVTDTVVDCVALPPLPVQVSV